MCVIIICDKKTGKPKKDTLKSAEALNGDGGSIAWFEGKKVRWEKGLNSKQIWKIVKKIQLPYVIHFRIATHGGVNKPLCHPFPISENVELTLTGKANKVLFHNGIWEDFNKYSLNAIINHKIKFPDGKMSDSRAMAWLVHHFGEQILGLISGSGNKMVIMEDKQIRRYGKGWTKVDEVYCSNDHFDDNNRVTYTSCEDDTYDLDKADKYLNEDEYLYDEYGDDNYEFAKSDCEYNDKNDCYIAPDGTTLYSIEQIENHREQIKKADKELEDVLPIGQSRMNISDYEDIRESEKTQWNKRYFKSSFNGNGGLYP